MRTQAILLDVMDDARDRMPAGRPRLVPELVVSDLRRSLAFWRDLIGFRVLYDRPEDRFAFLHLDGAEVMLEQRDPAGRRWLTAPFAPPLMRRDPSKMCQHFRRPV